MSQRYSDRHKMLIQAMLAKPVSNEEDMLKLYKVITADHSTMAKDNLLTMISDVNKRIKRFHMEIKHQKCELTGMTYYVLISLFPSPDKEFEKLIQAYSPTEREYFRLLVEKIVTSEERCILQNSALSTTVTPSSQASQNIGPVANSKFLKKFIQDGWLIQNEDGKVYLAVRAIAELKYHLSQTYEVESCNLCCYVCVLGLRCERDSCGAVVHSHCLQKARKSNTSACPKCGTQMRKDF